MLSVPYGVYAGHDKQRKTLETCMTVLMLVSKNGYTKIAKLLKYTSAKE